MVTPTLQAIMSAIFLLPAHGELTCLEHAATSISCVTTHIVSNVIPNKRLIVNLHAKSVAEHEAKRQQAHAVFAVDVLVQRHSVSVVKQPV